ncbi:hypothetical protein NDU88_002608 [Pleurodeles waltl]|uniref:Uncharacterized protein n=1 Tax=Pleurodeles waltl TaxID=8319 RepID=A0AAV7RFU8_PLEWA|nr:hypothetical protein NDU88_002608 [Pleurodeles waltl]
MKVLFQVKAFFFWRRPPWRNMGGANSSDSERNQSMSIQRTDKKKDTDVATPESRLSAAKENRSESAYPLVEAINHLKSDKEAPGGDGGGETEEATL